MILKALKSVFSPETGSSGGAPSYFRAFTLHSGSNLAMLDRTGLVQDINPCLQKLLNRGAPALRRQLISDDASRCGDVLKPLLEGRVERLQIERRMISGDGRELLLGITLWPLDEADHPGAFTTLMASVEDLNGAKRDSALIEAETRFRSIFENAIEGIFQTTEDGHYLAANPALARIYGYETPDQLMAGLTNIASQLYVDPTRRDEFLKALAEDDQVQNFESQVYRRDGSIIWISESCRAVRNMEGDLLYFEGLVEDITTRKTAEEQLIHDALHDALTGLPNRTLLQDRLGHAIEIARRESSTLAVMFIDLDRFKNVNDSLGHDAGDSLLVTVTSRLKDCMRRSDTIARLGGDEFVVILSDFAAASEVAEVAEKIVAQVMEPMTLKGHEVHVGASIGIALYPQDGEDVTSLMKGADTAMYRAKNAGRSTFRFFDAKVDGEAVERLKLEAALRRAIENREFELFYQPKIQLNGTGLAGAEALIRWNSPERGLVPPDMFIPLAEETGLIIAIGDWVLSEACRQLADWQKRGLPPVRIAVNVSARQFMDERFCDRVAGLLKSFELDPSMLEVELTESTVMADPEKAVLQLQRLREIGLAVSVDDFGTGYSSLSYLKKLPLNTIKIDRSFVRHLDTESDNAAIVRAILGLGMALGMTAIAEGVETLGEEQHLQDAGCQVAQGFKYSKPIPANDFEEWLGEYNKGLVVL